MGWRGDSGIGATQQGRTEPIDVGVDPKKQRGVRSPLVGVATSEEHIAERGPEVFGFLTKVYGVEHLQLVKFTYKGAPEATGEIK